MANSWDGVHLRLDQQTSGALVLGKNAAAASKVQKEFEARRVEKHYVAVCRGVPASAKFVVDAPISKGGAAGSQARRHVDLHNGLSAFTAFEVPHRGGISGAFANFEFTI